MDINEIYQTIIQQVNDNALIFASLSMVLAIALYLSRKAMKQGWLNIKNRYRLNHLGVKHLCDVQWPDGLGSYFTIDRLILRPDGITVLVYIKYPGKIFCADDIDEWTQMLGQQSYKFKNPLYDLDCLINAIKTYVPNVPVNGFLFFDHTAEFPKGHPDRVIHYKKIPETLQRNRKYKVEDGVMSAWKKLNELVSDKALVSNSVQLD